MALMTHDMERGVTLGTYNECDPGVGVALHCNACMLKQVFRMQQIIDQLNARGIDGARTGIRELAGLTRQACPSCGARKWETRPHFPGTPMGLSRETVPVIGLIDDRGEARTVSPG